MESTPKMSWGRLSSKVTFSSEHFGGSEELHSVPMHCTCTLRSWGVGRSAGGVYRDAKLAVLEWDEERDTLRSSSLHYFEGDAGLRAGHTVFPYGPRAVSDPQVSQPPLHPDGDGPWRACRACHRAMPSSKHTVHLYFQN